LDRKKEVQNKYKRTNNMFMYIVSADTKTINMYYLLTFGGKFVYSKKYFFNKL